VNVFAVISALYLLNCRSLSGPSFKKKMFENAWIPLGLLLMAVLQAAFTHTAFMNRFFHSAPLDAAAWVRILAVGAAVHALVEIEKWWSRKRTIAESIPPPAGNKR